MSAQKSELSNPARLPRHLAIVMDGNGRWAKKRFLPRMAGHYAGYKALKRTVQNCIDIGIEVLTIFAFSSENWQRPLQEVNGLLGLFNTALRSEANRLHKKNVRLQVVGDTSLFSKELTALIDDVEQLTANNTGLKLVVAAGYGGRWDILQATQKIARQIENGQLTAQAITPELFSSYLSLADLPEPDLCIRTSGEKRISNFLLWQLAYTELYFTDVFWPDFDSATLTDALAFYTSRQRRFGCTGEQVQQQPTEQLENA